MSDGSFAVKVIVSFTHAIKVEGVKVGSGRVLTTTVSGADRV